MIKGEVALNGIRGSGELSSRKLSTVGVGEGDLQDLKDIVGEFSRIGMGVLSLR